MTPEELRDWIANRFAAMSFTTLEESRGLIGERFYYIEADQILSQIRQAVEGIETVAIPPESYGLMARLLARAKREGFESCRQSVLKLLGGKE